jgi:hypothetical protein
VRRPALLTIACATLLTGCGGGGKDAGGLTAGDRDAAQAAMDALHGTNIPLQLVNLTSTAQRPPAACRVHLETRKPGTFTVYVFWTPYTGVQSYTWLNMRLTKDKTRDTFHLGTAAPVLPGGVLSTDKRSVVPGSIDYDTPLAGYGPQQDRKNRRVMLANAGDAFAKPGASCQVLMNGSLRLVPNT